MSSCDTIVDCIEKLILCSCHPFSSEYVATNWRSFPDQQDLWSIKAKHTLQKNKLPSILPFFTRWSFLFCFSCMFVGISALFCNTPRPTKIDHPWATVKSAFSSRYSIETCIYYRFHKTQHKYDTSRSFRRRPSYSIPMNATLETYSLSRQAIPVS